MILNISDKIAIVVGAGTGLSAYFYWSEKIETIEHERFMRFLNFRDMMDDATHNRNVHFDRQEQQRRT